MRTTLRWVLGVLMVGAGVNHFLQPGFYVAIMPPYLPWPGALVALSGVAEVAVGLAVLVPRLQRVAGWGLVALLLAVFPANVHMALHPARYDVPAWGLWLRLPLQGILIAWALWSTRGARSSRPDAGSA